MTMSDPIADMLTRIRNANTAKHDTVDVPSSKMKLAIAQILLDEGYIRKFDVIDNGNFKTIHITLKYGEDKNDKIISGIKRISKPGLRVYAGKDELPRVLGGLGVAIISTNQGVVTDKKARELQVGGEVFPWDLLQSLYYFLQPPQLHLRGSRLAFFLYVTCPYLLFYLLNYHLLPRSQSELASKTQFRFVTRRKLIPRRPPEALLPFYRSQHPGLWK